ncbi:hypothetical protein TYRP_021287 [Tyrophagus putrescentiae]|nr:hypothetical protein TYRP_021287 [Tyrophagus putrescentiae]
MSKILPQLGYNMTYYMAMAFYFIITVLTTTNSRTSLAEAAKPAGCDTSSFEKCLDRLIMFGDESFVYPTNLKEMNKRCREVKDLSGCTNKYVDSCLKGETKNSVKIIMYGVLKSARQFCSTAARKSSFFTFGACVNRHRAEQLKAVRAINRQWHGIKLFPDAKMRLPMICCTYSVFKRGMLEPLEKRCTEKEVTNFERLIDSYASEGLNLLCSDYTEDSDRCAPLLKKIPKWTKAIKTKVIFLTIVDVLDSL